jgi:hypothetical protein
LPAVATMVDDEVLGHALGDRKSVVLLDQGQREIDAGGDTVEQPTSTPGPFFCPWNRFSPRLVAQVSQILTLTGLVRHGS